MEVRLLEVEQELFAGIPDREEIGRATVAETVWVEAGPWEPPRGAPPQQAHFGLLILDGLMLRTVRVGGRESAELLGAGDVLRPWATAPSDGIFETTVAWRAQRRARLAILDEDFARRVARWPSVASALMDRLAGRHAAWTTHLSIIQAPNLQIRLRSVLWNLAERWGRVTPEGVRLDLSLTHQLLADLVGASRPPVTTALGELERDGHLSRVGPGSWLLRAGAPEKLRLGHDRPRGCPGGGGSQPDHEGDDRARRLSPPGERVEPCDRASSSCGGRRTG
jgi:hypothetical protein